MTSVVWFRDDLRLTDHAALSAAAQDPDGCVALYVLDEESEGVRPLGGAARWWLHESLVRLADALASYGVPLVLRRGNAETIVPAVAKEAGANGVFWNRRYGAERHIDARIKTALRESGTPVRSFPGSVLFEPWTISTQAGGPYRVYSAFWRACLAMPAPAAPLPQPESIHASRVPVHSDHLDSWALQPSSPNWATGIAQRWTPGEDEGVRRLVRFLDEAATRYVDQRDRPSADVGSELSPYLRWGEISPRTVWQRALASGMDVGKFLSELGWREFARHTAYHHAALHLHGLNQQFDQFPWNQDASEDIAAWRSGETGFPLVDAGMRELWQTGFMHNRVRMVTASFITKNLLVDWRIGEAWFWDTLVDADAASNPFNWQWVAGCGADAAPYFRIFNPVTQQERFDPEGDYTNRWAPDSASRSPLVDLRSSRARALSAYEEIKARA
ncbi:cryptochrome/photolyase family protein [Microbacterium amylolyticum]|uniref:Deoxyribodipyrimidine photo-lyase n=1 Tax=Microbacterium amylolyticum TaxID=936337 RepID=A0ABS4ZFK6_9MICO|nr:deoxyribodipyrimidine photo-lyase [Microbacterium amylolyticum]MBP2436056.1 deoxyribodipyrimidine photo-lyase [Microbacterium amylolyticum]